MRKLVLRFGILVVPILLAAGCATGNGNEYTPDITKVPEFGGQIDLVVDGGVGKDIDPSIGTEGGPCYSDNTCDPGLICIDEKCMGADSGPPDTTVDTVPPDTTVDTVPPDTTVDTVPPDTTVDTVPPDTTVDTVPPDTTVDTLPPDTTVDTGPVCGNGVKETGEACDDGNTVDGDQCNADCTLACPSGKTYNLHCYRLLNGAGVPRYWHQAQQNCEDIGMHLVTLSNLAEAQFVSGTLGVPSTDHIWLGFTDMAKEGTWKWVTGEAITYTGWTSGEPND
ncbi:MAG: lectin-like protein, partial [Pseudomonadota bacterium]